MKVAILSESIVDKTAIEYFWSSTKIPGWFWLVKKRSWTLEKIIRFRIGCITNIEFWEIPSAYQGSSRIPNPETSGTVSWTNIPPSLHRTRSEGRNLCNGNWFTGHFIHFCKDFVLYNPSIDNGVVWWTILFLHRERKTHMGLIRRRSILFNFWSLDLYRFVKIRGIYIFFSFFDGKSYIAYIHRIA